MKTRKGKNNNTETVTDLQSYGEEAFPEANKQFLFLHGDKRVNKAPAAPSSLLQKETVRPEASGATAASGLFPNFGGAGGGDRRCQFQPAFPTAGRALPPPGADLGLPW